MIRFSTLDVEMPPIDPQRDKAWIEAVARGYGKSIGELYYYFCSDERLLEINKQRLGHDFYTDIVTFPLTDCETVLSSSSTACCTSLASTTTPTRTRKPCVKKRKKR